ncbi:PREDICTED: bcl-2-binding component 3 [Dipodomys ordii]|uniref:Bcl-2-binding component 3 n=1 Tax=Dipodomys ordii TaxID=10020 RepID=A0A1S3GGN4_DIPOR|nr:PREDICTED: bcl-2-binding component 3 [Dipodomys ordii]
MLAFVTRRGVGAPGSAMARARQEGSSPEPVEGLARDSPRPFPLGRLVPSAVSCGLCEPGLPRQEEQQRHRPSPWRVLYNIIMGLLPLPRGPGAPQMEPN